MLKEICEQPQALRQGGRHDHTRVVSVLRVAFHERHAADRAIAGPVRNHVRMHRTDV